MCLKRLNGFFTLLPSQGPREKYVRCPQTSPSCLFSLKMILFIFHLAWTAGKKGCKYVMWGWSPGCFIIEIITAFMKQPTSWSIPNQYNKKHFTFLCIHYIQYIVNYYTVIFSNCMYLATLHIWSTFTMTNLKKTMEK